MHSAVSETGKPDAAFWLIVVGAVFIAIALVFILFAVINSGNEIVVHRPAPIRQV